MWECRSNSFGVEVRLSDRQRQVLNFLVDGMTTAEMGKRMFLSPHTVRCYRNQLLEALGARNASQAVHIAHRLGLFE